MEAFSERSESEPSTPSVSEAEPSISGVALSLLRWLIEIVLFGALGGYLVLNSVFLGMLHANSGPGVFVTVLVVCVVAILVFAWATLTDLVLILGKRSVYWPTLTRLMVVVGLLVIIGGLGAYLGPE